MNEVIEYDDLLDIHDAYIAKQMALLELYWAWLEEYPCDV